MRRETRFLRFCARALGSGTHSPLREINGSTISALVEAFKTVHPIAKPDTIANSLQTFEDPIFSEPWSVYMIRNAVNARSYIGVARSGFTARYPKGDWWSKHGNERLSKDVLAYGLMNFRVLVYVCIDEKDMNRQEAELLRANRLYTYNLRAEYDN